MPKSLQKRFESKYAADQSGCWVWTASVTRHGYGQIRVGSMKDGSRTMTKAHRVAWAVRYGPIPDGLWVLHRCDNRRCVNPNHLFLGTHEDNMADMMRKGREARGERQGHARLTDAQVEEIRALGGKVLQREIAETFGTCQQQVSKILRGKQRRKLTDPDPALATYQARYRLKETAE